MQRWPGSAKSSLEMMAEWGESAAPWTFSEDFPPCLASGQAGSYSEDRNL
ncbi:hypothetical protein B7760_05875 (plasmid) [Burkholderia glumae]|nr:hypothetical protein B7760_05875 [Burkholderia glumae]